MLERLVHLHLGLSGRELGASGSALGPALLFFANALAAAFAFGDLPALALALALASAAFLLGGRREDSAFFFGKMGLTRANFGNEHFSYSVTWAPCLIRDSTPNASTALQKHMEGKCQFGVGSTS